MEPELLNKQALTVVEAAVRTMAMLRAQVELMGEQLDELEKAVLRGVVLSDQDLNMVVDALKRHSLDCAIKFEWAVKAVAMYRDALES